MKRRIILGLIIFIMLITLNGCGKKNDKKETANDDNKVNITYSANEIPKFIDGEFSNVIVKTETDALKAIDSIKDKYGIKDTKKELRLDSKNEANDITYYRFNQIYEGIEVYKTNLILSVDKKGNVLGLSGYYIPNISVDIKSTKSIDDVEKQLLNTIGIEAKTANSYKAIYVNDSIQKLVYIFDVYSNDEVAEYIVDASTGEVLYKQDLFEYEDYVFNGYGLNDEKVSVNIEKYYDVSSLKTQYKLVDTKRNIEIVDSRALGTDLFGLFTTWALSKYFPMSGDIENDYFIYSSNNDEAKEFSKSAITTLKNMEDIYDYFANTLGINSYDGNKAKIIVNIGMSSSSFGTKKLSNAAWSSLTNQMYVGYWNDVPFGKSKDVLAHEFTHAIVNNIASFATVAKDKNTAFETGALNEGIADIFGSIIDDDWLMNDKIETVRDIENPLNYDYPQEKGGTNYYPDGYLTDGKTIDILLNERNITSVNDYDNGGVHKNSTVVSHSAYLMYKNGAFKSKEEMAKVWYNALYLMPSYADFEDCALAVIKSAKDLNYSSKSIEIIRNAFIETKMLDGQNQSPDKLVMHYSVHFDSEELKRTIPEKYSNLVDDSNDWFSVILYNGTVKVGDNIEVVVGKNHKVIDTLKVKKILKAEGLHNETLSSVSTISYDDTKPDSYEYVFVYIAFNRLPKDLTEFYGNDPSFVSPGTIIKDYKKIKAKCIGGPSKMDGNSNADSRSSHSIVIRMKKSLRGKINGKFKFASDIKEIKARDPVDIYVTLNESVSILDYRKFNIIRENKGDYHAESCEIIEYIE